MTFEQNVVRTERRFPEATVEYDKTNVLFKKRSVGCPSKMNVFSALVAKRKARLAFTGKTLMAKPVSEHNDFFFRRNEENFLRVAMEPEFLV